MLTGSREELEQIRDLKKTDYFDRVQMRMKKGAKLSVAELITKMKPFDEAS